MIDMPAHEIVAFVGHGLLWSCLIAALPVVRSCPRVWRGLAILCGLVLVCVPWSEESVLLVGRGLVHDLSPATQMMLLCGLCASFGVHNRYTQPFRRTHSLLLALMLVALYASTMGYLPVDFYAWGYEPQAMLVALAAFMALTWYWQPALALGLLAGLAAFNFHLMASPNLWDYLSDPVMCAAALVCIVIGDVRCSGPRHNLDSLEDASVSGPVQRLAA
jgi:hypothetical protein